MGERFETTKGAARHRTVGFAVAAMLATTPGCYEGIDPDFALSGGDADGDGDGDGGGAVPAEFEPAPVALRLLLSRQHQHAIADLLGEEAAAAASPPPNFALNGFDTVGASQQALSDAEVDAFERSARAVAIAAWQAGTLLPWVECDPQVIGEPACLRQFTESFGRVAWRRPLTDEEIERYTAVGTAAANDLGGFELGLRELTAAMLQSPHFIYQVEVGEPDPDDPDRRRLTAHELAARISLFVVDTIPDAELRADAEAGLLQTTEGIVAATERLLARAEAKGAMRAFFSELWRLRELATRSKDATTFPQWSPQLGAAMQEETLALVDDLVWARDADFMEVFTADYTFANDQLGYHYGLPEAASLGANHQRVELSGHQKRGGLFGHASFQTLLAHVSTTSPTLRGKFVLETILCRVVHPPPPGVVTNLPDTSEAKTMRERLEAHMQDPTCAGCHSILDPIGFGLENYDAIGSFRTTENGYPIDATSSMEGAAFEGAAQLGAVVAERDSSAQCLTRNLFRHATGHIETEGEEVAIEQLERAFADSGHRMQDLVLAIVASPAFRLAAHPE